MNTYKVRLKTFSISCETTEKYESRSSREAIQVLRSIFTGCHLDESNEAFVLMMLDCKAKVIGYKVLATGTETAVLVSPAMILRSALVLGGTCLVVAHNHPSGDPTPSREDDALTSRLRSSCDTLGLPLADHIILGDGKSHSYRASQGWV